MASHLLPPAGTSSHLPALLLPPPTGSCQQEFLVTLYYCWLHQLLPYSTTLPLPLKYFTFTLTFLHLARTNFNHYNRRDRGKDYGAYTRSGTGPAILRPILRHFIRLGNFLQPQLARHATPRPTDIQHWLYGIRGRAPAGRHGRRPTRAPHSAVGIRRYGYD